MKLCFAGPLFSAAERDWSAALAGRLRAAGHELFLPQEQEGGRGAAGILATDVAGIDGSDARVARRLSWTRCGASSPLEPTGRRIGTVGA